MFQLDLHLRREGGFSLDLQLQSSAGILVLYGASGSGKTTVLDLISGAQRPDRGSVSIDGTTLFDAASGIDLPMRHRRTPRVYQEGRLFPHLSVHANLLYGARHSRDLDEAVEMLELQPYLDRKPAELSGGQRQRVAVGRALLAKPRAVLLDEPLASLDLSLRMRILPYLKDLRSRFQIPFVYVTHALEEALTLGEEVAVLDDGKLIERGNPSVVLAHGPMAPAARVISGDSLMEVEVLAHHLGEGITECRYGDALLLANLLEEEVGSRFFMALSSRDVILSLDRPQGLSARNAARAKIVSLASQGDHVAAQVLLDGAPAGGSTLVVSLTPQSVQEMKLEEGSPVVAIFKASALRPVVLPHR